MPTPRHPYTLVGFSDELDWRELNFVEPIPWSRICQACGLVTRVTGLLPCRHVFCKKCYEQCRSDDGQCCPLDGQLIPEEDVEWMECPVHNLLKRKVKCWNEDRGCEMVLPASELNKHFCKDCDHHSTSCPRCSMVVRCNNVCAHMQRECRDHGMSVDSGNAQRNTTGEKAMMMVLNANIDTRVGEMKERLDHLTHENNVQSNRLNEISHSMNTVKETLLEISSITSAFGNIASSSEAMRETLNDHGEKLQQLAGTINNSHETLKGALESTKRCLEQKNEDTANTLRVDLTRHIKGERGALKETLRKELKDAAKTILCDCAGTVARIVEGEECERRADSSAVNSEKSLALSRMSVKQHEFVVEGINEKKERALSKSHSEYVEKNMYISGYHVSPGVYFQNDGGHVFLYPYFQLHKGVVDDVLEWPLKKIVRLTFKHPSQNKRSKEEFPEGDLRSLGKPYKGSNSPGYFTRCWFGLHTLELDGYVTDDSLRVVWELV